MTNNKAFLGLMLSCLILASYAQQACCEQNRIRVTGNGQTKISPDSALISVSLQYQGATAIEALTKLQDALESIYTVLSKNGVAKSDISASYWSTYPKYDYSSGTGVISGQIVYITVSITIRGVNTNSKKIAQVVDGLISVGISSISGVTYDTVDPNTGKSIARKSAWNDAVTRAKQYAQFSGRKLGKVLVIDQTNLQYSPYVGSGNNTIRSQGADTSNAQLISAPQYPEVPIGQINVSVNVIVVWELI